MFALIDEARRSLLYRRRSLRSLLRLTQGTDGDASGEALPDVLDRAARRDADAVRQGLGSRESRELLEIEDALRRIDAGQYGRCETCDGAIGRQRLRALPEARRCFTCASPALQAP